MKTGKDLGFPEDHPFHDAAVISEYTTEQAVDDGILMRLGTSGKLLCTTNFAHTVVGGALEAEGSADRLRRVVSAIVSEYTAGNYACPKRADKHGEADAALAVYLVDGEKFCLLDEGATSETEIVVWAIGPGDGSLTLMLPEDY